MSENFISFDDAASLLAWRWTKSTFRKYVSSGRLGLQKLRSHGKTYLYRSEVEQLAKGGKL